MKHKIESKLLYAFLFIIAIYLFIIISNIAIPIIYHYILKMLSILTPFIIAFFLAFLLHTLVDKIENRGFNRALSVLFVFLVFILILIYIISSLIPLVYNQIVELETQIPNIYNYLNESVNNFWERFDFVPEKYKFQMHDLEEWTMSNVLTFDFSPKKLTNIFDSFNIIVLTPIITYYLLYDYNKLRNKLRKFLTRRNYRFVYHFLKELDSDIGAYFRGLILVMNLMTIVSSFGFFLIGLDYPLLFGFITGYINIIPIIGPYIGGIPVIIFALTKSFKLAILSLIIIIVLQLIESNIVTPYVQSKSIDAHPLLILMSFVIFGKLFGILGMIFAIPLLAIILILIKYTRIYLRLKRIRNQMLRIEK